MGTVLLVVHLLVAIFLVTLILMQRSEAVSYTHLTLPTIA